MLSSHNNGIHCRLVLLRHGQSTDNREKVYSGWRDVDLTEQGIKEAENAALLLKKHGYKFDVCYSSMLKRAIKTAMVVLDLLDLMWIPLKTSWRLNEGYFGQLTGQHKDKLNEILTDDEFKKFRTVTTFIPPQLDADDKVKYNPLNDPKYDFLCRNAIPRSESIDMILNRMLPYWIDNIFKDLLVGKNVLICTHGNQIRSTMKHIFKLGSEETMKMSVLPNGFPYEILFDEHMQIISHGILGNKDDINISITKGEGMV